MAKVFKNELVLEKNSFNTMTIREDKTALAQVIQNLLFIEKGTYPNQPELGIGIENYLFEKIDKGTCSVLKDNIKEQIEKFAPSEYLIDVQVESKIINSNVALLISFSIKDTSEMTDTRFGVLVGKSEKTKKTISKLIV